MNEVRRKIEYVRSILEKNHLQAVRLRGVDWFSWATGGGTSVVIMTAEVGVAEVLITLHGAWILTNKIESRRLKDEEIPKEFELTSFAWQEVLVMTEFVREKIGSGDCCSDRPTNAEKELPQEMRIFKMKMQPEEIERYRIVSANAAAAMTDAIALAEPNWSEHRLAGAGADALWSRGLEPTLILVAGHQRGQKYRHPIAKNNLLGNSAMMVFCARGYGLYANLTRFVYFCEPGQSVKNSFEKLEMIEAVALSETKVGGTLRDVYASLEKAYRDFGVENEINLHHQGGPTGYLSRELVARPQISRSPDLASDLQIEKNMAFAWNPSLPGAKLEDTVLVGQTGIEVMTLDPRWPSKKVGGLERPQIWIRA